MKPLTMPPVRSLLAAAALLAAGKGAMACASPLPPASTEPVPTSVGAPPQAQPEVLQTPQGYEVFGTGAAAAAELCRRIAEAVPPSDSVGVLPFAYFGRKGSEPDIPAMGVTMAEDIAHGIQDAGFAGEVLSPSEMGRILDLMNVGRIALFDLQDVLSHGDRLGVDVVVFGTVDFQDPGLSQHRRLDVKIHAVDVVKGRNVAREARFSLPNVRDNTLAYRDREVPSAWDATREFPVGAGDGDSFMKEMEVAAQILSRRLVDGFLEAQDPESRIYVATADSSAFVRSVAELSAMMDAYWAKVADLQRQSPDPEGENPYLQPVTLGRYTFETFDEAKGYLFLAANHLRSTDSYRFCQSVSNGIAENLREDLQMQVLHDLVFLKTSNADIEQEIITGGLTRDRRTANMLLDEGIEFVVQPIFERYGKHYQLRARIFDLEELQFVTSKRFPIGGEYSEELAKVLEVQDGTGAPVSDLRPVDAPTEARGWPEVYDQVATGVVWLVGTVRGQYAGHGTGFVVAKEGARGLIMTNAHVTEGLRECDSIVAYFRDPKAELVPIELGNAKPLVEDAYWDVAILESPLPSSEVHVFEFADRSRARVGAEVAVVGHPKGAADMRGAIGQVFSHGYLMSLDQAIPTSEAKRPRPSYMFNCPTRGGSSGSPVLLMTGQVVAVNSHGKRSEAEASSPNGGSAMVDEKGNPIRFFTELPGFATGAPGHEASRLLESARSRRN